MHLVHEQFKPLLFVISIFVSPNADLDSLPFVLNRVCGLLEVEAAFLVLKDRARPRGWRRVRPVRSAISISASSPFGRAYIQV